MLGGSRSEYSIYVYTYSRVNTISPSVFHKYDRASSYNSHLSLDSLKIKRDRMARNMHIGSEVQRVTIGFLLRPVIHIQEMLRVL